MDINQTEHLTMSIHDLDLNANPTCDNECGMLGWSEAIITAGSQDLHISHHPKADLDGTFKAFCHDEQEMIRVSGWQIEHYEWLDGPTPSSY